MRTFSELLGLSPAFGNQAPPPPFADWSFFSGPPTPYAPPGWVAGDEPGATVPRPIPDFAAGGLLGPHLAARAAEANGSGGILGPVVGVFGPPPEPAVLTGMAGTHPAALFLGLRQH